jgi:hypothetical protein
MTKQRHGWPQEAEIKKKALSFLSLKEIERFQGGI